MYVIASSPPGMTVCAVPFSRRTPSISTSRLETLTCAPMPFRKAAKFSISGRVLALRITVFPRARQAASITFSVPEVVGR